MGFKKKSKKFDRPLSCETERGVTVLSFVIVIALLAVIPFLYFYIGKEDSSSSQGGHGEGKVWAAFEEDPYRKLASNKIKTDPKTSNRDQKGNEKNDQGFSSQEFAFLEFDDSQTTLADAEDRSALQNDEATEDFYERMTEPYPYPKKDKSDDDGSMITGRVLNEKGEPVANIHLSARLLKLFDPFSDEIDVAKVKEKPARTDVDGFYEISGLNNGEYEIFTDAQGNFSKAKIQARSGSHSADLILKEEREVWVYGVVENSRGDPLHDVRVSTIGNPDGEDYTNQEGRYGFYLSMAGNHTDYTISFKADGYAQKRLRITHANMDAANNVPLDVRLESIGDFATVAGFVRDTKGTPVAGETVRLIPTNHLQSRYQTISDSNGNFKIDNVEPGNGYQIHMQPVKDYKEYRQGNVVLNPNQNMTFQIVLESLNSGGAIGGRIMDISGKPLPNFPLLLRSPNNAGQVKQVVSDLQGNYFAENVPHGPLFLESQLYPKFIFRFSVEPNEEKEANLVMDIGNYEVVGRVLNEAGAAVPMQSVSLTWSQYFDDVYNNSVRLAKTDAQGYFRFSRVGHGLHKITIRPANSLPYVVNYLVGGQQGITIKLSENQLIAQND